MRGTAAIVLSLLTLAAQPAWAQQIAYAAVAGQAVAADAQAIANSAVDDGAAGGDAKHILEAEAGGARVVSVQPAPKPQGIAAYGPFRVLDETRAALVDVTDTGSPDSFGAMLRDHPGIGTIEMIACPGTEDDGANLRLGRMIRGKGIVTHVPEGGFVGSGAVELFLAGLFRFAEPTAEFAVHSWEDESGREATDYAPDAPQNRAYIDYYQEIGMTEAEARAFYAMTNSVPFAGAKWLTRADMAQWVRLDSPMPALNLSGTPRIERAQWAVNLDALAPALSPSAMPKLDLVLALK